MARRRIRRLFLGTAVLAIAGCAAAPPPPEPPTLAIAPSPSAAPSSSAAAPPAPDPLRAPSGYVEMKVLGLAPGPNGGIAVLLADADKEVVVPIFIGGTEALSIELRLGGDRHPRPLTHDLLDAVMKDLGGELVKVQIDELRDGTFYGSVFVRRPDRAAPAETAISRIDARPSDAIALALGSGVPIFVARTVVTDAGVREGEQPRAGLQRL